MKGRKDNHRGTEIMEENKKKKKRGEIKKIL